MRCEPCFNDEETSDHKNARGLRENNNFNKLIFTN